MRFMRILSARYGYLSRRPARYLQFIQNHFRNIASYIKLLISSATGLSARYRSLYGIARSVSDILSATLCPRSPTSSPAPVLPYMTCPASNCPSLPTIPPHGRVGLSSSFPINSPGLFQLILPAVPLPLPFPSRFLRSHSCPSSL